MSGVELTIFQFPGRGETIMPVPTSQVALSVHPVVLQAARAQVVLPARVAEVHTAAEVMGDGMVVWSAGLTEDIL